MFSMRLNGPSIYSTTTRSRGLSSTTRLVKRSRIILYPTDMSAISVARPSPSGLRLRTLQSRAERHEFRIALNVGDEIEHLFGGVAHATFAAERRHAAKPPRPSSTRI